MSNPEIDEATERPVGIESVLKKTDEEKYSEEVIIQEAQLILGKALIDYFSGELGNALIKPVNSGLRTYLVTLGPFTLQIYPNISGGNECQNISVLGALSADFLGKVYAASFGEYSRNTDLIPKQNQQVNLSYVMTEFTSAYNFFQMNVNKERVSAHPLIIAMNLKPENRVLYAVAAEHAMKSNELKTCSEGSLFDQVNQNVVPTKAILEVAELYKVEQLKDLMIDINHTISTHACWRK